MIDDQTKHDIDEVDAEHAHWVNRREELRIVNIVKDCLTRFGTVDDVISQLIGYKLGEPPEMRKPKSLREIKAEYDERRSRGEQLESEIAERERIMRAVEILLNHAIENRDFARVEVAADVLTALRESAFCNYPVEDLWHDDLKRAWNHL